MAPKINSFGNQLPKPASLWAFGSQPLKKHMPVPQNWKIMCPNFGPEKKNMFETSTFFWGFFWNLNMWSCVSVSIFSSANPGDPTRKTSTAEQLSPQRPATEISGHIAYTPPEGIINKLNFHDFAHIPWIPQTSPNTHKERNSFINGWWNVWGIFQGYVGEILEILFDWYGEMYCYLVVEPPIWKIFVKLEIFPK